jgi:DNA-binding response OmpR family regulator
MKRILVVEDNEEQFRLVTSALGHMYDCLWAKNISDAQNKIGKQPIDLMLLDIHLPDGMGYDLCALARAKDETRSTPIIFVSGNDDVNDKIMGFSLGADDYIVKPFNPLELRARVESKLRRSERKKYAEQVIANDILTINLSSQRVFVNENGQRRDAELTGTEFKLLALLAQNKDILLSRNQILDRLWGVDSEIYDRSVDTHVSKIRKKLGAAAQLIQSVHRSGYRFAAA